SQPDSAYRVRQTQLLVALRVAIPLTPRLRFTVGPLLKYAHTPSDPGTVLATTGPYYGAGDFGQVGVRAGLELDTRDHTAAPARGVHLSIVGQGYPAVWDAVHPFGSVSAEASTYLSAGDPPSATLALRAGGAAVSGTVPFQELVYVGGGMTVRGYAEQRFAGRRGAYGNVALRLSWWREAAFPRAGRETPARGSRSTSGGTNSLRPASADAGQSRYVAARSRCRSTGRRAPSWSRRRPRSRSWRLGPAP